MKNIDRITHKFLEREREKERDCWISMEERKILVYTPILATKIINFEVNEFYLVRRISL